MQLQTYISDLLYRYDCVVIPDFGAFVSQRQSAVVNAATNTFLAPKKSLLFNEQITTNDGLLARYIADVEQIPYETVNSKISKQVERYKSLLIEGETLSFNALGDLAFNEAGKIVFTPNNSVNYLPESFGLHNYISPKISREVISETTEEVAVDTPIVDIKQKAPYKTFLKYAAVGLIALTVCGFAFSKYQLNQVDTYNKIAEEEAQEAIDSQIQEATFVIDNPLPAVTFSLEKKASGNYHIIAGAFRFEENCDKAISNLKGDGFKARKIGVNKYGLHEVAYASYETRQEALEALKDIKLNQNPAAWLLVKAID